MFKNRARRSSMAGGIIAVGGIGAGMSAAVISHHLHDWRGHVPVLGERSHTTTSCLP
jgi:hypothetical protein